MSIEEGPTQLREFVSTVLFRNLGVKEVFKLITCILLERQLVFVSESCAVTSRVMFTLRDILLNST